MTCAQHIRRTLTLASVMIGLAGCESEQHLIYEPVSEISIALQSDLRGTNPGVNRDVFTDDVLMHVVESLVAYGDDLSVVPLLAERIERSDDGKRYLFHLRNDVIFHNGAPMTSAEVVWSWERMLAPETNWLCRIWFDGTQGLIIESVKAIDRYTVEFVTNRPDFAFLDRLANLQCSAAILHPDSLDDDGAWAEPVGTGPFSLNKWERGEYVLLKRHDAFRKIDGDRNGMAGAKTPLVDYLRWVIIPDPAAAKSALLSGQVDLTTRLQISDLVDLSADQSITIHKRESLDWNVLLVQSDAPPFNNLALRQAIAHAIDSQTLATVVSDNVSKPNASIVARPTSHHGACHEQGYIFDAQKARLLVEESGYAGQSITLITNKRFPNMFDNALIIQRMLMDIGLTIELEVIEWTTQLDRYFKGDFQLMSFGYTGRTDPTLAYKAVLGRKSDNALFQWENDAAIDLLERSARELNADARRNMFCELHQKMIADTPMVNLYNHYVIEASSNRISGYEAHSTQKPRLWGVALTSEN